MFRGKQVLEAESRVDIELHIGPGASMVQTAGRVARTLDDGCMCIEFLQVKPKEAELLQQFLLPRILQPEEPVPPAKTGKVKA